MVWYGVLLVSDSMVCGVLVFLWYDRVLAFMYDIVLYWYFMVCYCVVLVFDCMTLCCIGVF